MYFDENQHVLPHRRCSPEVRLRSADRAPDAAANGRALTAEQARAKVLDASTWGYLNDLAARRFPRNANLADEALLYVLDKLEEDNWRRVRVWQGRSPFTAFLRTVVARLFTDFVRLRFGQVRKSRRLTALTRSDALWDLAYEHVVIKELGRREAIEHIIVLLPNRSQEDVERAVSGILRSESRRPTYTECHISLDSLAHNLEIDSASTAAEPADNTTEILEQLATLLLDTGNRSAAGDIQPLCRELRSRLSLNELELQILRLRFAGGMSMKEVAARLELSGSPSKQYRRLLRRLRDGLAQLDLK